MEKIEGKINNNDCMSEDEILMVERIVQQMAHYIKEMKNSYYSAKHKVATDRSKENFALHQKAFIAFGNQALEYSDLQLPTLFSMESTSGTNARKIASNSDGKTSWTD